MRGAEVTFADLDDLLAQIPLEDRPAVYLAREPLELETAEPDSSHAGIICCTRARDGADAASSDPPNIPALQILIRAPDAILIINESFAEGVGMMLEWTDIPAAREGTIFLSPALALSSIDVPPLVKRSVNLHRLAHEFYRYYAKGNLEEDVPELHKFLLSGDAG